MNPAIQAFNQKLSPQEAEIGDFLTHFISEKLPEASCKIWHAIPVWFIHENPIVGYSSLKKGIQLLFWSGQSFEENPLEAIGKFKAAGIYFQNVQDIPVQDLTNWLQKSKTIQWDYKNLVKRKGVLERLNVNN
ncbi:DUF1801 domain-containing protein [Aquirufa nivalisilvae]|uniref:DUF1801 domain-containing protein n=1 Tax=Aquirufa nivalisilvae TaxID=2516557 RepID=UPI0022A982EF|nr:DUF1801 domain-containing protein [Aquirufa nivalisilvae]MCZ2479621.1 DUF1801 domain-containing protein [Aquirufa nivalisilvae]MCZ2481614.1 DUF1801 domain-containing protein [Aquirufa nivalisilvae]